MLFDFGTLPSSFSGVPLFSFGIEISLDSGFREQMLGDCLEHNKVSEVKSLSRIQEKRKTEKQGLSVTGISVYAAGWMKTDRREKIRILNFRV